uniref:TRAPP trafficking subunit Trs65-domain-containing protein n=3 Tax=Mesocestoides corti TaxID=53468 RepID=A0A5K3EJ97_MESCO
MAKFGVAGESFVQFLFSPTVGVLTSADVDKFMAPNNLTFVDLLLPFSGQIRDVCMKDGNNISHVMKKLRIRFHNALLPFDLSVKCEGVIDPSLFPPASYSTFYLNGKAYSIPVDTFWFEYWRHSFISGLGPYAHEYLTRYLGCLFVVTTCNPDPLNAFTVLVQEQANLVRTQPLRWFSPSKLPSFFVLINDTALVGADETKRIYQSLASTYGNANCYLLNLSSQPKPMTAVNGNSAPYADPWLCYLTPHGWATTHTNKIIISPPGADSSLVSRLNLPHGQCLSAQDNDKLRAFVEDFVIRILVPWAEATIKNLNDQISHRLRKSRGFFSVTRKLFAQATGSSNATAAPSAPSLAALDGPQQSSLAISSSRSDSNVGQLVLNTATPSPNPALQQPANNSTILTDDSPEQQMRRLADLLFLFQQYESAHQIYDLLKRDFRQHSAWLNYAGAQEMSAISTYLQGAVSQRQYPQHQMDDAIITYITRGRTSELALRAVLLHTEALKSRELFAEAAVCFLRLADAHDYMTGGLLLEQAAHCCLRGKRPLLRHFAMRMALAGVRFARAKQPHLSVRSYSLALKILSPRREADDGWSLALDHINENLARQKLISGQLSEAFDCLRRLISPQSHQLEAKQARFLRDFVAVAARVNASNSTGAEWIELSLPVVDKARIKTMLGAPVSTRDDDGSVEARGTSFSDDEDGEDAKAFYTQRACLPHNFISHVFPTLVTPDAIPAWMVSTDSQVTTWDSDDVDSLRKPGEEFVRLVYGRPTYPLARDAVFRRLETLLCLHCGNKLPTDDAGGCLVLAPPSRLQNSRKSTQPHCLSVGEQLTVQIPLHNPWRVPLVLTDMHLMWQASFAQQRTSSDVDSASSAVSTHRVVVSNEDANQERLREAKKFVTTELLSEFYMLPGDRKAVELSIQPRQYPGDVQIVGLAFYLNSSSPHQSTTGVQFCADGPPSVAVAAALPAGLTQTPSSSGIFSVTTSLSSLALSSTTPQVDMSVGNSDSESSDASSTENHLLAQDPLSFKPASPAVAYGSRLQAKVTFDMESDLRFQWKIQSPRPSLKAIFDSFPQHLFEGEIYGHSMTLINVGLHALTNLHLVCSWPSFFVLPPSSPHKSPPPFITPIAPTATIEPSASRREQFWLRAPASHIRRANHYLANSMPHNNAPRPLAPLTSPSRKVYFVFGYSSQGSSEFRFLRHEANLYLLPSLHFTATCSRTQGTAVDSLFVILRCKNASLQHAFRVVQLTCISEDWDIELVAPAAASLQDGVAISPTQEVTLCVRASRRSASSPAGERCSDVVLGPLSSARIDAAASPHVTFFRRAVHASQLALPASNKTTSYSVPETDLQPKNLVLIAFWRVITPDPNDCARIGQSHVHVVYSHTPASPQSPPGHQLAQVLASVPSLLPLSSLVRLRLHHPFEVVHDFAASANQLIPALPDRASSAMAVIPVTAELYNASSAPITVRLSTSGDYTNRNSPHFASNPESSAAPPDPSRPQKPSLPNHPPSVLWSGVSLKQLALGPGETQWLSLKALAASPGVYEVNSFCVKASQHRRRDDGDDEDGTTWGAVSASADAPFVRQLCDFSSLVVVSTR